MNAEFLSWRNIFILFVITTVLAVGVFFIFASKNFFAVIEPETIPEKQSGSQVATENETPSSDVEPASSSSSSVTFFEPPHSVPPEKLANPPEIIKAVYVTAWSAGSKPYLNYLTNLFETTEINAVVVDIKDYSGLVSYFAEVEEVKKYNLVNGAIYDIDSLVRFFHSKNIYVIGRLSVFEDPAFAGARPDLAVYDKTKPVLPLNNSMELSYELWQDYNGLFWLDPASKQVWDYNVSLAKDAFYHGFDEINFDYVRFPSDGEVENMGFPVWDQKTPMASVIKFFFQYLRTNLSEDPPAQAGKISVDLFGQTTTSAGDMGIGQVLENAFESFDYISPMVYPSHYENGFIGFQNPAEHPYEVVKYSLDAAVLRENKFLDLNSLTTQSDQKIFKFRPWLQDFDLGADYTAEMVKQEIKATKDSLGSDYAGYMLWNPSNIYTLDAILKIH